MKLEGKRVIVTGGSRGIGFRISELFMSEGATVLAVSRSAEKLVGAKEQLPDLLTLVGDVSDPADVDKIVAWAQNEWGALDILINNAGVFDQSEPGLTDEPDENFFNTMRINVHGAYFCTKRLLPLLLKSDDPHIINLGSTSGMYGPELKGAYGVSKAAVHAMTFATANELEGKVTVNALDPGWVRTDMSPDGPGDPRWSARGALSIVTREDRATGRLFSGTRLRSWTTRANL